MVSSAPNLDRWMPKIAEVLPPTRSFALTGQFPSMENRGTYWHSRVAQSHYAYCSSAETPLCHTLLPDISRDERTLKNSECIFVFGRCEGLTHP